MKNKIKLLHIDYDDLDNPWYSGGQSKATYEMYSRMSDKYSVTVITGKFPKSKNITKNNISYKRVGIGRFGPAISIVSFWFLAPIYASIYQDNYNLISEFFTAPIGPTLTPTFVKKNVIGWGSFLHSEKLSKKYHIPFDYFANKLFLSYKHLIALSEESAKLLTKKNPQANIVIIPRGIDDEIIKGKSLNNGYAFYIGRIDIYNKGLDLLMKSWKLVINKRPNSKLIIAGVGTRTDVKEINRMIKSLKLQETVSLVGKVHGKIKRNLLLESAFVVNPSRFETFSNVALETLAAGKIFVCFDIDGLKWVPNRLSKKIKPFMVNKLSEAIMKSFVNRKSVYTTKEARKFAKKFLWKNVIKKTDLFYKSVFAMSKT